MNRYQNILGHINYSLFLAIVALLPFPQIFLRYACVLWIITWALEGRWLNKPHAAWSGAQNQDSARQAYHKPNKIKGIAILFFLSDLGLLSHRPSNAHVIIHNTHA